VREVGIVPPLANEMKQGGGVEPEGEGGENEQLPVGNGGGNPGWPPRGKDLGLHKLAHDFAVRGELLGYAKDAGQSIWKLGERESRRCHAKAALLLAGWGSRVITRKRAKRAIMRRQVRDASRGSPRFLASQKALARNDKAKKQIASCLAWGSRVITRKRAKRAIMRRQVRDAFARLAQVPRFAKSAGSE